MRRNLLLFLLITLLSEVNLGHAAWVMRRPMNYPRYGLMVAEVNSKIYAIGGFAAHDTAVGWVEEYNPGLDTWILKAPMLTRSGLGICGVVNGKIYVIGGIRTLSGQVNPIESCEVYDPVFNQWQRTRRFPIHCYGFNGGAIGQNIYVAGGYLMQGEGHYTETLEVYSTIRDSWFVRSSMEFSRVYMGAAVANNKLYCFGGIFYGYSDANEEYDPTTNIWTTKAHIPLSRSGFASASSNNNIYAIGGQRQSGPNRTIYSRVDIYDVFADTWRSFDSLNVARIYAGAVNLRDRIYVVGGQGRNNTLISSLEENALSGIEEINNQTINRIKILINPNPFVINTTIRYANLYGDKLKLNIYNNFGNLVKTFDIKNLSGAITWDGTDKNDQQLPQGIYFAKINGNSNPNQIIKLIISR
jgi:N-acetylneuraminic acid mutarotase